MVLVAMEGTEVMVKEVMVDMEDMVEVMVKGDTEEVKEVKAKKAMVAVDTVDQLRTTRKGLSITNLYLASMPPHPVMFIMNMTTWLRTSILMLLITMPRLLTMMPPLVTIVWLLLMVTMRLTHHTSSTSRGLTNKAMQMASNR